MAEKKEVKKLQNEIRQLKEEIETLKDRIRQQECEKEGIEACFDGIENRAREFANEMEEFFMSGLKKVIRYKETGFRERD